MDMGWGVGGPPPSRSRQGSRSGGGGCGGSATPPERARKAATKSRSPTKWQQKQAEIQALQLRSHSMQSELRTASGSRSAKGMASLGLGDSVLERSSTASSLEGSPVGRTSSAQYLQQTAGVIDGFDWTSALDAIHDNVNYCTADPACKADAPFSRQTDISREGARATAWWAPAESPRLGRGDRSQIDSCLRQGVDASSQREVGDTRRGTGGGTFRQLIEESASAWEPEPDRPDPSATSGSDANRKPVGKYRRDHSGRPPVTAQGSKTPGAAAIAMGDAQRIASEHRAAAVWVQEEMARCQGVAELDALQGELAAEQGRRRRERFDWQRRLHRIEEAQVRTSEQVEHLAQEVHEGRLPANTQGSIGDHIPSGDPVQELVKSQSDSAREVRLQRLCEEVDLIRGAEQWKRVQQSEELSELREANERWQLCSSEFDEFRASATQRLAKAETMAAAAVRHCKPLELELQEEQGHVKHLRYQVETLRGLEHRSMAQQADELEALRLTERRVRAELDRDVGELLQELRQQKLEHVQTENQARERLNNKLRVASNSHAAEIVAARTTWEKRCVNEVQLAREDVEMTLRSEHAKVTTRLREELDQQDEVLASFMDLRATAHGQAAESQELLKQLRRSDANTCRQREELLSVQNVRDKISHELEEERTRFDVALKASQAQHRDSQSQVVDLRTHLQEEANALVMCRWRAEQVQAEHSEHVVESHAALEKQIAFSKVVQRELECAKSRVEATDAENANGVQYRAGHLRSAGSARDDHVIGRLEQELVEARHLAERREGCLAAELDMLLVENRVLKSESRAPDSEVAAGSKHSVQDRPSSDSQQAQTSYEAEAERMQSLLATENQLFSEVTSLRAQLADASRRHSERLQAERRGAEKSEDVLLRKVYWFEEAECKADKVLQDQLSEDMEIMGELRRRADDVWAKLEGSHRLFGKLQSLFRKELDELPEALKREAIAELNASSEDRCAKQLSPVWEPVGAGASANAHETSDGAEYDEALLQKSAWCASAFLGIVTAARSSVKSNADPLEALSSSSSLASIDDASCGAISVSAFLDTPPRTVGVAAEPLPPLQEAVHAEFEIGLPETHEKAPQSSAQRRSLQLSRQQDVVNQQRERERARGNAQLEEKIRLLQASLDAPASSPDVAANAGGRSVLQHPDEHVPIEDAPTPGTQQLASRKGSHLEGPEDSAHTSGVESRLRLVAARLAQLIAGDGLGNIGVPDHPLLGDLPQLADRVGERLADCEARCRDLQKELQTETRLRRELEREASAKKVAHPVSIASNISNDNRSATGHDVEVDEEKNHIVVVAAAAAEAERQAHLLVLRAETCAAEAEDRLRAVEADRVRRDEALTHTEARLEHAEARLREVARVGTYSLIQHGTPTPHCAHNVPAALETGEIGSASTLPCPSEDPGMNCDVINIKELWSELEEKQRELRQLASSEEVPCIENGKGEIHSSSRQKDGKAESSSMLTTTAAYPESPPRSWHRAEASGRKTTNDSSRVDCHDDCGGRRTPEIERADINSGGSGDGIVYQAAKPSSDSQWRWNDCRASSALAPDEENEHTKISQPGGHGEAQGAADTVYPSSPPHVSAVNLRQGAEASRGETRRRRLGSLERQRSRNDETAAEVFGRAECLCEVGKFREAVPLFRRVIAALHRNPENRSSAVEAEVWAHLGVAMQSLDDIDAAIESYKNAVKLDQSLHVCFANLATLYSYLGDVENARKNVASALVLDPMNEAYRSIQVELDGALAGRPEGVKT